MTDPLPSFAIYLVFLLGGIISLFRPHCFFYIGIFLLSAISLKTGTFTRTPFLGPYLNLSEAIQLTMFLSTIVYLLRERRNPRVTRLFTAIVFVLIIGTITIFNATSLNYDIIRDIRWAFFFPLIYLISMNNIHNEHHIKPVLVSLYLGAIASAIQHIFYVVSRREAIELSSNLTQIRTLTFDSSAYYFLICTPLIMWGRDSDRRVKFIYYIGNGLFFVSLLINQTRSMWIASALTFIILVLTRRQLKRVLFGPVSVIGILVVILFSLAFPWLNILDMVAGRFNSLQTDSGESMTRLLQINIEFQAWLDGNLLTGRGLGMSMLPSIQRESLFYAVDPAWGHVGHVAYLARLGILGLIVYSIYLPITTYRVGKIVLTSSKAELWKYNLGMLGISCVIYNWIVQFMSGSYLSITSVQPAILIGVLWGIWYNQVIIKNKFI